MKLTYRGPVQMRRFEHDGKVWEGVLKTGGAYGDLPTEHPHIATMLASGMLVAPKATAGPPPVDAPPATETAETSRKTTKKDTQNV